MKNPLALPLLIVSLVAGVEAVALLVLVSRDSRPAPAVQQAGLPQPQPQAPAQPQAQPQPQPPSESAPAQTASSAAPPATTPPSQGVARGRKGQRVESAGFGITVEQITADATYPNLLTLGPEQRYLALRLVVDNNTGGNAGLFPALFRLQDENGFEYERLNLPLKQPTLEWRTMGNRESIRGYIDFVVPKSAKGLKLIYSHLPASGSKPIHVELGE